ncbi:MAG: hypothetical protein MJB14_15425, partial [Spirochaetes bacterium]|nr:hypothetical protein [Spirochaetota bacterium]
LTSLVNDYPLSDYKQQALKNIAEIAPLLSSDRDIAIANEKALLVFEQGQEYQSQQLYEDAIKSFQDVVLKYPQSTYTQSALDNIIQITQLQRGESIASLEARLREKFKTNYQNFESAYEKGDLKAAREYYFGALANAFNIYADNSVAKFQQVEEEYISSLMSTSSLKSNEDLQKQLEETRTALEQQYDEQLKKEQDLFAQQLAAEKSKLESEKTALIEKYEKLLSEESQEDLAVIKTEYDNKLAEQNQEIARLKQLNEDYQSQITAKVPQEKINELTESYENQLAQLKSEIEVLEDKYNTTSQNLSGRLANSESQLTNTRISLTEREKELEDQKQYTGQLKNQLLDLYAKYEVLEKKAELAVDEDKKELKTQLETLEKKYNLLEKEYRKATYSEADIRKQIEAQIQEEYQQKLTLEKKRLQQEFATEIDKLKNIKVIEKEIAASEKADTTDFPVATSDRKIIARIIEVIGTSVSFQFLSNILISEINMGDTIEIIRFSSGEEKVVGSIKITYIPGDSLFGRGRIFSVKSGFTPRINDLLKN